MLEIYHGTSGKLARKIMARGFRVESKRANWAVKSKKGFVYFSSAYALFFAMKHNTDALALIKVAIPTDKLYPEDDFLMLALGKPVYIQS